ncbi:MAG: hypothetical protein ACSHWY_10460 [Octadecabacter sp.]
MADRMIDPFHALRQCADMVRFLLVCIVCVWGTVGTAQTCDGMYDGADALIEQAYTKYGTLYSGGTDYASVGPTLEIYRLLSGLPDSGMATPRPREAAFVDPAGQFTPEFVEETLVRSLPRLHDANFRRDRAEGSTDIEVLLNRLTVIGPFAGWWLTPDAPQLTDIEQVIAPFAEYDGLDWVLTVQAASARPHNTAWHLQRRSMPQDMAAVLDNAAANYDRTESLPWLVAVHLVSEGTARGLRSETANIVDAIEERTTQLRTMVAACTASPADYVALSIATYEQFRQHVTSDDALQHAMTMPATLRRMAGVQAAKYPLSQRGYYRSGPSADDLIALADDPAFAPWQNVGRSILANDIDALIAIHDGAALDPKTYRLLNLLSADDLIRFANSRDDGSDARRVLITAAYLRLFALGRDDAAAGLVDDLRALWPAHAELIARNWNSDGARDIRLARVALSLPEPRTLIVPPWNGYGDRSAFEDTLQSDHSLEYWSHARRSRDLPIATRTGGFMTRDLSVWMRTNGSNPYAMWQAERRTYRRGIIQRDVMDDVRPPMPQLSGSYYGGVGIAGFAAWDELAQLGPETGLANRIGREIVMNARAESTSVLGRMFGVDEKIAWELELVVQQGRRMIHGDMDGEPLGQAAFNVLHNRFARSDAAQATPYWFTCRERCEP